MTIDAGGFDRVCLPNPARVLIVTDVRLYREGLARLLGEETAIELATAAPGEGAFASLSQFQPSLVLADCAAVRTPGFVSRVTAVHPEARVVAFAVAEEDEEEILACAEAGVSGFVPRDASVEGLKAVLQAAAEGHVLCSPRVTAMIVRRVAGLASSRLPDAGQFSLTRRESEIVGLIDTGLSNKEIAAQLNIETATVKNHVHSLLEKLRVRRRADAAAIVRMRGLPRAQAQRRDLTV